MGDGACVVWCGAGVLCCAVRLPHRVRGGWVLTPAAWVGCVGCTLLSGGGRRVGKLFSAPLAGRPPPRWPALCACQAMWAHACPCVLRCTGPQDLALACGAPGKLGGGVHAAAARRHSRRGSSAPGRGGSGRRSGRGARGGGGRGGGGRGGGGSSTASWHGAAAAAQVAVSPRDFSFACNNMFACNKPGAYWLQRAGMGAPAITAGRRMKNRLLAQEACVHLQRLMNAQCGLQRHMNCAT